MIGAVMPVINCREYTCAAIDSMHLKDSLIDVLLVIDNGSTDDTLYWLEQYQHAGLPITIQKNTYNIGVAASWNQGIDIMRRAGASKFIIANNDIICARDTIEALVAAQSEMFLGLATARAVSRGAVDRIDDCVRVNKVLLGPTDFCLFAINSVTYDTVGPFDESFWPAYYEDRDYIERMKQLDIPYGMAMNSLVYHHGSKSIREGGVRNWPHFSSNQQRFLAKHPHATI